MKNAIIASVGYMVRSGLVAPVDGGVEATEEGYRLGGLVSELAGRMSKREEN